ncbi:MAG: M42 family metallopeptidase [Clostridia bacterium]|nr:M42 family metallopeptidase [Clostridia bacterium]
MKLLENLVNAYSVSGQENDARELLIDELKDLGDISVSPMGNLTLHIKGNGEKILFAAHMDQIGLMVTYIEDGGFLRFATVGGIEPRDILNQRVRFKNGTIGCVCYGEKKEIKDIKLSDMYIDIAVKDKEEAETKVSIGDCAVYAAPFVQSGNYVVSPYLDNKVGCYILAEAAKRIKNSSKDLYFVFTVQEEIGLRGAKTAAFDISPDYAIALDVTATGDTPDGYKMAVKTGEGIAVKVKDNSLIAHPAVKEMIVSAAEKTGKKYQYEVLEFGGTDGGALQLSGSGVPTGVISIPTRYTHTANETASIADITDAIDVICEIVK